MTDDQELKVGDIVRRELRGDKGQSPLVSEWLRDVMILTSVTGEPGHKYATAKVVGGPRHGAGVAGLACDALELIERPHSNGGVVGVFDITINVRGITTAEAESLARYLRNEATRLAGAATAELHVVRVL